MSRQEVDLNTDHITYVGDDLKTAFTKVNENTVELYNKDAALDTRLQAVEAATGGNAIVEIVPGANVTVDNTDPLRPIVSATGGGTGGSGIAKTGDTLINDLVGSGSVRNLWKYSTAVKPGANSNAVFSNMNQEITYNETTNITAGGWLNAEQTTVSIGANAGAIDKVVAHMSQINIVNNKPVGAVLGYEATISAIGAATNVTGGVVGFFFPNLRNVPNIARLDGKLAAFVNQDPNARIETKGIVINGSLEELAPAYHPGLRAGRYYTAPHRYSGKNWMQPNIATAIPIHIPSRCTIADIGIYAAANADKTRRIIFAIYTAENGRVQNRVWQSPAALTAPDMESYISQAVNVQVDAGTYWLVAISNVNFECWHHSPTGHDLRAYWYGQPSPNLTDAGLHRIAYFQPGAMAVGMFPLQLSLHPETTNSDAEPHVMFRVA